MSRGTVVSLHIEKTSSPASSFCDKKPLAGLLFTLDTGEQLRFSIAQDTARIIAKRENLFIGCNTDDIGAWIDSCDNEACWSKILSLLKRRDYACEEIRRKLLSAGFGEKSIDEAIKRAYQHKFLNDQRFAKAYIRSKINSGWGRSRIIKELELRGIDIDLISDFIAEILNDEEEYQRALEIIQRKQVPKTNIEQKFIRFLVGRGFTYPVSKRATRRYLDDIDSDSVTH